MEPLVRTWRPHYPLDLARILGPLFRGGGDPVSAWEAGVLWRAFRTPAGVGTVRIAVRPCGGEIAATAWGPGADWLLEQLPALLGADDEPERLVLPPGPLREVQRRNPDLRLGRSGLVMDSLIPAVLEQKVTVTEAYRGWRYLVRRFGAPAPGPRPELRVMPSAREWALIPSWEWHKAGVDPKRAATIARAVRLAPRLEEASTMTSADAFERLMTVPGIGIWTAAETLQRSNGDPDAVSVGDYHLANHIGYALTGRARSTDEQMLELLEPYAGQRHRVCRLIRATGTRAPRFGPRLAPNDHRHR
ncbi:DNA-3-methyladenine glycosylase 2 family protein [Streptomyces sp. SP17BM10]|uniref:DNA-3-methyladenine glycosylase family protein n=1 Tax=Streptomyces sp. SP17BM10 TaxID=3002530 RepID=UPI002E76192A|nr:DNA-3-methyladenine glycosylase 2 family protein [Streptomyces sp. SP17BM10]MEE1783128.1 DNA-3-methyladenine glycosylase 2 family protein [Streptomyces sp. SP17BM10]